MNLDIDQRIDESHAEVERVEAEARQIEARIIAAGGVPPTRPYGRPVSGADVGKNLTLRSLLQRRDPALAAFLGFGSDIAKREAEAAAARELQAERMRLQTEQLRARNQQAQQHRERAAMAGISTTTGRRFGS